jgi:hypothetical protein
MGRPDWSKVTPSGKSFEEEALIKKTSDELGESKKEIEILKKENKQLRELLEDYTKKKK